jgi:hypothetical protein
MFDSLGCSFRYFTNLRDVRRIFHTNGTFNNVTKYRNTEVLDQPDTYSHYIQRAVVISSTPILKKI